MARQTIEQKVEALEQRVTKLDGKGGRLGRIESQIVHLRSEVRDGLSAIRAEIRAGDEETRRYMRVLHEDLVSRIAGIQQG